MNILYKQIHFFVRKNKNIQPVTTIVITYSITIGIKSTIRKIDFTSILQQTLWTLQKTAGVWKSWWVNLVSGT